MFDIALLEKMQQYYQSGITRSYQFRIEQLKKLKAALKQHETELHGALYTDLKKNPEECWITETGFLLSEINYTIKHLRDWMQTENRRTNLINFPSKSYVQKEPLGVVLIIGPWNYPLQLLFTPLVGAIAAGNCAVLKSSEFAPATSTIMRKITAKIFPQEYVLFTEGDGQSVVPAMLNQFRFDHVFYTGSSSVGKSIYQLCAEKLVPVTLELGGKSPAVVENDANLQVAAKRIAVTKFSNAGQMCVAPDYILVHESVKDKFIEILIKTIEAFYSSNAINCYEYGKIIHLKQFNRLVSYLKDGDILYGGKSDVNHLFIEPTILTNVSIDSPVMKEEIFGPILPVISFNSFEEAKKIIEQNHTPLSFYIFTSSNKKEKEWTEGISFGGGCINNCSWHFTNPHLPFGGKGFSGIGAYHGKNTFDTFSHKKSIMKSPNWFDPSIKYPPVKGKLKIFKWLLG